MKSANTQHKISSTNQINQVNKNQIKTTITCYQDMFAENIYIIPLWVQTNHGFEYNYCLSKGINPKYALRATFKYTGCPEFQIWTPDRNIESYLLYNRKNLHHFCSTHGILDENNQITATPVILPEVYKMDIRTINHVQTPFQEDEKELVKIYNYIYFGDYNAKIEELAALAQPENWDFEGTTDKPILKNYIDYTFRKLVEENKVLETDDYCLINTGLITQYYDPIYIYGVPNEPIPTQNYIQKWRLVGFKDQYELGNLKITQCPERANYFTDPEQLIFNPQLPINVQYNHILSDLTNISRMPEELQGFKNLRSLFSGAVDIMKKKVASNYKLAIPQYYNGKIQLLLPLCLLDQEKADLALVVSKSSTGDCYQGHTCLTLKMAYNNARLISKSESSWLKI